MSVIDVTTAAVAARPAAYETTVARDDGGGGNDCRDSDQRWRRQPHHPRRSSVTTAPSVCSKGSTTVVDIERGSWPLDTAANSVTDRTPLLPNGRNLDDEDDVGYCGPPPCRNACVDEG